MSRNIVIGFIIATVISLCSGATRQLAMDPTCPASSGGLEFFYQASLGTCASCPEFAQYDPATANCVCKSGYATYTHQANGTTYCVDCASNQEGVTTTGTGAEVCIPCAGLLRGELLVPIAGTGNYSTVPATGPGSLGFTSNGIQYTFYNSSFDNNTRQCGCVAGTTRIETLGRGISLGFVGCVACQNTTGDSIPCPAPQCPHPKVFDFATSQCVCPSGFTSDADGRCMLSSVVEEIQRVRSSLPLKVPLPNLNGDGQAAPDATSWRIAEYLDSSTYWCSFGNQSECNRLANLCVLVSYDVGAAPCVLYQWLHSKESCRLLGCEVPTTLPWIHYLRSSPVILQSDAAGLKIALEEREPSNPKDPSTGYANKIDFVLSTFAANGTWLGNTLLTSQLHTCDIAGVDAAAFWEVGSNRRVECELNLRWYAHADETVFYELYYRDMTGKLVDVPVLLDYGQHTLTPHDIYDGSIYREGSDPTGLPAANGYKRRFYMYDNIGPIGRRGDVLQSVVFARRTMVLVSLQPTHESKIFTPLLIIQYQSAHVADFAREVGNQYNERAFLRTNNTADKKKKTTAYSTNEVKFSMSSHQTETALMITLIVFCVLCLISSWLRVYGWMRRQQNLNPDFRALFRWLLYCSNHVANCFAMIVVLTSGYFYLFFKHQSSVEFLLPDTSVYLFAMLYTSVTAKGVVVLYKLLEQCKIDWFVIDWERPRGTSKEGKPAEVTMWRSTFVANELNELQNFRIWNPLFCMVIIMVFLEGGGYIDLALSMPAANIGSSSYAYPHPILRIAVDAFFWVVVPLTFYVLQHQIYFRFLAVHPLRGFIDLCSVANISVVMLLEPMYGFYIHGESIHDHADASMAEFQTQLRKEGSGFMPQRGIGGKEQNQVFEVYMGFRLRETLSMCYRKLFDEYLIALGGIDGAPAKAGKHRSLFEVLTGSPGQVQAFTPETLNIKADINDAFRASVRGAEKSLQNKEPIHRFLDFTPNIGYMNGYYSEQSGSDLYYVDQFDAYSKCLLAGLDMDLFVLYLLLFVAIDSSLLNSYIAVAIVYVLDVLLCWFRKSQGQANLGAKTMFDERFFV